MRVSLSVSVTCNVGIVVVGLSLLSTQAIAWIHQSHVPTSPTRLHLSHRYSDNNNYNSFGPNDNYYDNGQSQSQSQSQSSQQSPSELVAEALQASQTYGPTSPEARVAWEAVEHLSARDNSIAYTPSAADGCVIDGPNSHSCIEYTQSMMELHRLVEERNARMRNLDQYRQQTANWLQQSVRPIKLSQSKGKAGQDSPQVRAALQEAYEVTHQYGFESPEAKMAWSNLEEVSSAGLDNAMGPRYTSQECMVMDYYHETDPVSYQESIERCQAVYEVDNAIQQLYNPQGSYTNSYDNDSQQQQNDGYQDGHNNDSYNHAGSYGGNYNYN